MIFIKRIFLLIPLAILLNGCFGGLASLGKILKISAFMHIFTGWGGRIAAIRYFSQEHTVTFYAIIIIILLIIVFVIYLEINSQEDYLIRPYKVLLGISLIAIVIYIIASTPEQKGSKLEMFDYGSDTSKETIDIYKYPYEDEKTWIKEGISCQSLEEEKKIQYCLEIKETCSEFIVEKDKNMKPFSTCVSKVRERLGMYPVINDQFPDWLKNDPVAIEIKEELQKSDNNQ